MGSRFGPDPFHLDSVIFWLPHTPKKVCLRVLFVCLKRLVRWNAGATFIVLSPS